MEPRENVLIFTKPGCPYCARAKDWYNDNRIPFTEKNAQDNREYRREMFGYSDGDPTVPVIVVDGRLKQIGWEGRG
ncbi:MAG: glutaredoxin [Acidobacteria bacterium]|nr:glutaredoxin [Acidobacteriota bacterium]